MKTEAAYLITNCEFETSRLKVNRIDDFISETCDGNEFSKQVISILTDEVTQSLPIGWQGINTIEQAVTWITERKSDGLVSVITTKPKDEVVGFLFLSAERSASSSDFELRLGYLLAKKIWGQGFGGELIGGLIDWSKSNGRVSVITGGVDTSNIGSIRVLEKNDFVLSVTESAPDGVVIYERKFKTDKNK